MAYFEQFRQLDGTLLFSGTIAAIGASSTIDTQYYGSVSIQVTGNDTASILAQIEGSNDGSNWETILIYDTEELNAVTDSIYSINNSYYIKSSHRYIRYNVKQYTGAPAINFLGRSGTGPNAADNLTAAFNPDTPLQVNIADGIKRDSNKGIFIADASSPIEVNFTAAGSTFYVDTQGYQSLVMQNNGGSAITATTSNDGLNWYTLVGSSPNSGLGQYGLLNQTNGTAGISVYPCMGRFIRLVASGAVRAIIYLRSSPFPQVQAPLRADIFAINGAATRTSASAGGGGNLTLAIAGDAVQGTTVVANPVTIGGVDANNISRRVLTDSNGRLLTTITQTSPFYPPNVQYNSNSPTANLLSAINIIGSVPGSYLQSAALNVQDSSQYEGQNQLELMAQILLELRILNQQMYELPRLIAAGQGSIDPPELLRQEPSIFNQ